MRTAAIPGKINYRRLTEINSRYYGHSLLRTLTHGPEGVHNKGSDGIQVHLGPILSVFRMNGIVLSTDGIVIVP